MHLVAKSNPTDVLKLLHKSHLCSNFKTSVELPFATKCKIVLIKMPILMPGIFSLYRSKTKNPKDRISKDSNSNIRCEINKTKEPIYNLDSAKVSIFVHKLIYTQILWCESVNKQKSVKWKTFAKSAFFSETQWPKSKDCYIKIQPIS